MYIRLILQVDFYSSLYKKSVALRSTRCNIEQNSRCAYSLTIAELPSNKYGASDFFRSSKNSATFAQVDTSYVHRTGMRSLIHTEMCVCLHIKLSLKAGVNET